MTQKQLKQFKCIDKDPDQVKRFTRKIKKLGLIEEIKDRRHHKKRSDVKRRAKQRAIARRKKKEQKEKKNTN